ncbi:MAG: hypothetical protein QG633_73 [Patescibacteria group bacterium]|nr:hypothetical protein [Patescibacteria group bacterium]
MKKSFYWSVAFIAALVFAGVYSTNVLAQTPDIEESGDLTLPSESQTLPPADGDDASDDGATLPPTTPIEDTDGDTIADDVDNCVDVSNEDQADADENGVGDACDEPAPEVQGASISAPKKSDSSEDDADDNGDLDEDGVADESDNCPITPNGDQTDEDENDIGDACEDLAQGPDLGKSRVASFFIGFPSFPSNVDICHANNGNGWVSQSPSINSILKLNNGHNGHSGDIIPPFWYKIVIIPFYFPGKNWNPEGQEIHANGCEVPAPVELDFGDAPDPGHSYPTRLVSDGARHVIVPGVYLGASIDAETDVAPASDALEDDNFGTDDEDGVMITSSPVPCPTNHGCILVSGTTATIEVTASVAGYVDAWVDWSTGGVFEPTDRIFNNQPVVAGVNELTFPVPVDGNASNYVESFLRVRFHTTDGALLPNGLASDGEVEDYQIAIRDWCEPGQEPGIDYSCIPVQSCKLTVVSQTGDEGVGNGNAVAAWIHTGWTHALESVATWIWDSYEVVDASQTEAKTFTKDFYVDGPVNDAMLKLAADNRYWITINGNEVASNTGELNYGAVTGPIDVKVTGNIQSGWNTITMKVENIGLEGYEQRPHDNPAAGIYELVINAEEKDLCEQPEEETSEVTICKYENSLEGNLLSDWDVWLDHWAQDDFKASTVIDGHDYEGTTEKNGCVTIADVPYGSYRLDEIMKDGWVNVSGAGSQVVVDSPEETFNLVNAHECNPELNLIENFGFETPIVVANGGAWEQFANGTPLLGWVADLINTTTDAPLEIQSGYSGWVGHDGSEQYAELDSTAPTTISQDVPTTPGNKYRLTYWRAARPGTEPTNNANRALVDGVEVDSNVFASVGGNPDWYPSPVIEFTAANTLTNIAFKDDGSSADSYGTFIDDVALYCVPPVEEHHNRVTICKYEVNDEEGENNPGMPGWTVGLNKYQAPQAEVELVAINDEREYEGVTGEDGCVTFTDVDLAEYYVEEDMQDGWEYFSGAGGGTVWNIDSDQGTYTYNLINQRTGGGDDESCLVEGYKYDEDGVTPLAGWFIGLEGYYYPEYTRQDIVIYEEQLIGSDVTDENGYYCIQGEVEGPGSNYSVYEVIQEGWDNIGAEINDDEVSEYYDNGDIASVEIGYLGDGMDVNFINQYEGPNDEQCSDEVDNDNDEAVDENDSGCQEDTPETPNDDDDNNGRPGSNRNSFRGRGEVLGATTETNFCPFLRDYQHINTKNDPAEVNKAKAFFNAYLGMSLPLDGTFDMPMFNAVVQFQNMFKPDVLDTWTEEFPSLNDNATGYLYQTTKWKINSIICPGYETFPDQLIMAPGTTI